jgi:tRNA 2-thiouridine synthesizing protein A
MTATATVDAQGLLCPLPVLRARKSMKALNSGEILEILATDPGSVADFAAYCKTTGDELVESSELDGVYRFLIRKI